MDKTWEETPEKERKGRNGRKERKKEKKWREGESVVYIFISNTQKQRGITPWQISSKQRIKRKTKNTPAYSLLLIWNIWHLFIQLTFEHLVYAKYYARNKVNKAKWILYGTYTQSLTCCLYLTCSFFFFHFKEKYF